MRRSTLLADRGSNTTCDQSPQPPGLDVLTVTLTGAASNQNEVHACVESRGHQSVDAPGHWEHRSEDELKYTGGMATAPCCPKLTLKMVLKDAPSCAGYVDRDGGEATNEALLRARRIDASTSMDDMLITASHSTRYRYRIWYFIPSNLRFTVKSCTAETAETV